MPKVCQNDILTIPKEYGYERDFLYVDRHT